jgi:hypothetical protein
LQVLPALAAELGVDKAIFLQQLHYWSLVKQRAGDEEAWVYNTQEEWLEQLPWLSRRSFQRIVNALRAAGLIKVAQPEGRNRRAHYAIDYDELTKVCSAKVAPSHSAKVAPSHSAKVALCIDGTESSTETSHKGEGKKKRSTERKVDRKRVTDREFDLAAAVVSLFNSAAGTSLSVDANLTPVVMRIREKPDYTPRQHELIIDAVFAGDHWWSGPPGIEVVYGNARQFEKSIELAKAAQREKRELTPLEKMQAEKSRIRRAQGLE